jgi:hypothetical protein
MIFDGRYTEVVGDEVTGLYAADGSINVVDASEDTSPSGIIHPCGAVRVTFTAVEKPKTYAPNGSLNIYVEPEEEV